MVDLLKELSEIASVLDSSGIVYSLVGGLAYSIWVEARATEDIDLLIRAEDWTAIPQLLEPLGFLALAAPMDFGNVRIRRLTKFIGDGALVLDFLFADGSFAEGLTRRVQLTFEGHQLFLAPPDVIIDLKKGRMSAKDMSDIEGLRRLVDEHGDH